MAALAALSGCATFGSNVKGSFSCTAPDGICAPSSSIDDRALAMIAGEGAISEPSPARDSRVRGTAPRSSRVASMGQGASTSQIDARRTQERVLRIVFQPYIDERGRLHEVTAVHAVVQSGEWQQQLLANASAIPDRNAMALVATPSSLADAVDRAELADRAAGGVDPNLPDPAVVAAARARSTDPVKAIQDDVAARLAPRTGLNPAQPAAEASKRRAETRSVDGAAPVAPATEAKSAAPIGLPSTAVGADAAARVKASPEYRSRAAQAESDAKAAALTGTVPAQDGKAQSTVRAASFPAAIPEEN
ncbi:TraV family lipoprotein [uncultured Sphingomonas sp.]|uniref:TraV family lipoprotein n=1 Tax=uncultured Sphingomonas sp. TaxID=158754 RepID=UPI00260A2033|nr:TraV family lipoprotein [uncultured Sphingomonas sp.]